MNRIRGRFDQSPRNFTFLLWPPFELISIHGNTSIPSGMIKPEEPEATPSDELISMSFGACVSVDGTGVVSRQAWCQDP
jgi:hypothetical protein